MKVHITMDGDTGEMTIFNVQNLNKLKEEDLVGKRITKVVLDSRYEETILELED